MWGYEGAQYLYISACMETFSGQQFFIRPYDSPEPFFWKNQPKSESRISLFHVVWTETLRQVWPVRPLLEILLHYFPNCPVALSQGLLLPTLWDFLDFARRFFSQLRCYYAIAHSIYR